MTSRLRPDDDSKVLRKYLDDIARYPVLAPERERELGRAIQDLATPEEVRKEAVDELVRGNLRFVVSYAKRFHSPEVSFLDLINEGNIGLIQAARRFDPERGVKFITYAVWWVRQAISNALSEQWGAIRLPHKQATLHSRLGRVKEALTRAAQPRADDGGDRRGGRPQGDRRREPHGHVPKLGVALGRLRPRGGPDARGHARADQRRGRGRAAPAALVHRPDARRSSNRLPKKERAILCRRFGIPEDGTEGEREPMTLQEIGEELHLSRERVRQIEAQAIARIKRSMKSRALKAFLN